MNIRHILWTGGWDSTFRVCQVLFSNKFVQPIYATHMGWQNEIIKSTFDKPNHIQKPAMLHEIQELENIRNSLSSKFPELYSRLLPIRFIPCRENDSDWKEEEKPLGPGINQGRQYSLLRLISDKVDKPIELCIEKSPDGYNTVGDSLIPYAEKYEDVYRLKKDLPSELFDKNSINSLYNLQKFMFPLLHVTRKEMLEIATKNGYADILKKTWSCREYRPNNKPCGECFCCKGRIRDGLWEPDPLNISHRFKQ